MRRSTAFESIEDPLDPAWAGHAHDPSGAAQRWRAVGKAAVVAVAALVLAVSAAVVTARIGSDGEGGGGGGAGRAAASTVQPYVRGHASPNRPVGVVPDTAAVPAGDEAGAPVAGSGWAPADATIKPEDRVSDLLTGDLAGIRPELIARLDELAVTTGLRLEVVSGWRSRHEQANLYRLFRSGRGNLAAVPGTSNHETGDAADVYAGGVALDSVPEASAAAKALGLYFPVPGEAWHVELVPASAEGS